MPLIRYWPAPPLASYIECFWWSHRELSQEHGEHMLPSGGAQLLFALHETPIICHPSGRGASIRWSGSIIHGPQSTFYVAGPKPTGAIVGVSFRPGAAGAVLGASMVELVDRHIALEAIWGSRATTLQQRLMSAAEPQEIFRILEQSLSARIHRPLLAHPAIAHALASCSAAGPPARIATLQHAAGCSPRHFIALFRSAVGLNPKHFYRIRRFNLAARAMAADQGCGFGDIAAATGYSDQAHMARDFREFAGVTPLQFRPDAADRPLHHRAGPTAAKRR